MRDNETIWNWAAKRNNLQRCINRQKNKQYEVKRQEQHRAGMIDNNYSQLRKHTNPQIPKPQSQDQEEKNVRKYMMKFQKTKSTATESWGYSSVVEHLPTMHETVGSIPA